VNASPPVFSWRNYLPLAMAETSKFFKKQKIGKFSFEELLSVSAEALGTSLGAAYAVKAMRGALNDYVRDDHKLVRNIEVSEGEYLRTRGSPAPPPSAVRRVYVSGGVRHTLYTPGPYCSNAQLLVGDGKVGSKHNKVSIAVQRTTFNDEWSQERSGRIRAKIEDDRQEYGPSAHMAQSRGDVGQADYIGRGREQRWSTAGEVQKSGASEQLCNNVEYPNGKQREPQAFIRRLFVATHLDVAVSGRRTSTVALSMRKFGLEPIPKDKLGNWREDLAREPSLRVGSSLIAWQREAGYFEVIWALPDVSRRLLWSFVLDEDGKWYRREKLFSPTRDNAPERADILTRDNLQQEVSRGPALFPFVLKTERRTQRLAAIILPIEILSTSQPAANIGEGAFFQSTQSADVGAHKGT
jgi:hypothetical protein